MSWRTPITLLALLAFVIGGGWYGWEQFTAPRDTDAEPSCVVSELAKGSRLRSAQVLVNVYNAGSREGLASQTLDRLRSRGFRPGEASNAPTQIRVDKVAIYDRERTSTEVALVRRQFRGPVRVVDRPDIGEGVDVVVGNDYRGVDTRAPRSVLLPKSERVCVSEPLTG